VPILVRSLAVSLANIDEAVLPLSMDLDFFMTLDTNISGQNNHCQIVDKYECAWWKAKKPRRLDEAEIFNKSMLEKCLRTHIEQIVRLQDIHADPIPMTMISNTSATPATSAISNLSSSATSRISNITSPAISQISRVKSLATPAIRAIMPTDTKQVKKVEPSIQSPCKKCAAYSHQLSKTILDLVNIQTYANTMLTCAESQWNIDMRRASTFNLLHEAVVIKEMAGTLSDTFPISLDEASVRQTAKQELERLKALPPSSHKWTWGERLTDSDVLSLRRSGTNPKIRIHSGYDLSLKDGKRPGYDSSLPTMPETLELETNTMADDMPAPPVHNVRNVVDFQKMRNDGYDPLGKRREPLIFPFKAPASRSENQRQQNCIPRISAELTDDNVVEHTLNADRRQLTPARDISSSAGEKVADLAVVGIEDFWVSNSEGNIGESTDIVPAVISIVEKSSNLPIEDMWTSCDDDMDICQLARSTEAGGASADALEDLWQLDQRDEALDTPLEDVWQSEAQDDLEKNIDGIEDEWLADDDDGRPDAAVTPSSSQPTINSQFMVSPSRITHQPPSSLQAVVDNWPVMDSQSQEYISPPHTPASHSFRRYGPEDFQNLQDSMFEVQGSDSEWSDEEE